MGVLKLSVIEEQMKQHRSKLKVLGKRNPYHVGNCDCPCWAFLKKGEIVADDISSTASWNID